MNDRKNIGGPEVHDNDRLAQATNWFLRVRGEDADAGDLPRFQRWLNEHPENATAYGKVTSTWSQLDNYASAPEIVVARRDALENARSASASRWHGGESNVRKFAMAAGIAGIALAVGFFVWSGLTPGTSVYETSLGERRTLTLPDGSIVTLDARSRMRVAYSDTDRSIALEAGQARFDVAKDSSRPFRVRAGRQTVQALGTQFNVELMADTVMVTLIEGQVAVTEEGTASRSEAIKLLPGQQLVVEARKPPLLRSNIDLERSTAWQAGKLFFDNEPLASAAARMNRYAQQTINVDASVGTVGISGVFNAGDTRAFTEAVTTYFPVRVEREDGRDIRLTAR